MCIHIACVDFHENSQPYLWLKFTHTCTLVLYVFARVHVRSCIWARRYAMVYRWTRMCKGVTKNKIPQDRRGRREWDPSKRWCTCWCTHDFCPWLNFVRSYERECVTARMPFEREENIDSVNPDFLPMSQMYFCLRKEDWHFLLSGKSWLKILHSNFAQLSYIFQMNFMEIEKNLLVVLVVYLYQGI